MSILFINSLVVVLVVLIHYEFLYRVSVLIPGMKIKHQFRIVIGVFVALIAHSIEIWIFALVYYFLPKIQIWGELRGNFDGSLLDCVYFSYTSYTTLGIGDIQPHGAIRHLVGLESLTGLLLITWTASFLFFEMQRYWNARD